MAVRITGVEQGSIAARSGICAGDEIVSMQSRAVNDVLDYQFLAADRQLSIELLRQGIPYSVKLKKREYDDLGLAFSSYLMDKQRSCRNKCVFCFIDQNPKGMRESIYFKDDDDRLSFLFGNYITLTNLTDHDVDRIIEMKISPINISVHTTNPELRVRMMHNRFAGESLAKLYRLAEAGTKLNTQLVLCPGLNDGQELARSLTDLGRLYPAVQSIACVPVGLTRYREGLAALSPFTRERAGEVIDIIEGFQRQFLERHGERLVYPADEFFLKAEREIPPPVYYEEFAQLDNGVGMLASSQQDFEATLPLLEPKGTKRHYTLVTGEAAFGHIQLLCSRLMQADSSLRIDTVAIKNNFFGGEITVTGLVTATDIAEQLQGKPLGELLILPSVMLRHEQDRFLDDRTPEELSDTLGIPIHILQTDGASLAELLEL